jgi:hypothetical protein
MTKQQAMACRHGQELHYIGVEKCKQTVGPRGGKKISITRVRVSGRCQTWKTRPDEFKLPVKYGLYESWAVDLTNCQDFHLAEECPLECPFPKT